jgi:hypothetical protein
MLPADILGGKVIKSKTKCITNKMRKVFIVIKVNSKRMI